MFCREACHILVPHDVFRMGCNTLNVNILVERNGFSLYGGYGSSSAAWMSRFSMSSIQNLVYGCMIQHQDFFHIDVGKPYCI